MILELFWYSHMILSTNVNFWFPQKNNPNGQSIIDYLINNLIIPWFQPGQEDDSDSTSEEIQQQLSNSSSTLRTKKQQQQQFQHSMDHETNEETSLWMTSTQFSQLLDKQEAFENLSFSPPEPSVEKKLKSVKKKGSIQPPPLDGATGGHLLSDNSAGTLQISSYLDSDALLPFERLKQVTIGYCRSSNNIFL